MAPSRRNVIPDFSRKPIVKGQPVDAAHKGAGPKGKAQQSGAQKKPVDAQRAKPPATSAKSGRRGS